MSNTGRIPLWLVGLVGGFAVITMLSLLGFGPVINFTSYM